MPLITSFNGDDNNNIKQMMIMLNNKNSVQKLLQVHNNISTQDRSKNSHVHCMDTIDVWSMIFPMPCALMASETSKDNQP